MSLSFFPKLIIFFSFLFVIGYWIVPNLKIGQVYANNDNTCGVLTGNSSQSYSIDNVINFQEIPNDKLVIKILDSTNVYQVCLLINPDLTNLNANGGVNKYFKIFLLTKGKDLEIPIQDLATNTFDFRFYYNNPINPQGGLSYLGQKNYQPKTAPTPNLFLTQRASERNITPICPQLSTVCGCNTYLCPNQKCSINELVIERANNVIDELPCSPTPTSTVSLEISGGASFHTSKCGLAAAGFQCCYPNLKEGAISLKGSFFDLFQGIWNTVQGFILSNIDSYIGIGTQSMKDAAFQGGSNINLCPRSEEGHKKQRFVDLASSVWLDKEEQYNGNPGSDGQVVTQNNSELLAYSTLLTGGTDPNTGALKNNGLINTFFNQETLPTGGVEYKDNQYACFCVDPEKQRDETPESFLSLEENASLKNAANSFRTSSNQVSDLKNRVLAENVEGVGAREGAAKMCRNITNVDERKECIECVSSDDDDDLGGAWTAVGCIKADFSNTLQNRLFPLFISFGGLISLGCIIYASFLLQTSMGEPEKITKAQELMTSCIAGLIMIIFSVFILRVIGVDILRLPGLDQEVLTPTPIESPTTKSTPSISNSSSTTSITSSTPAFTITAPLLATSSPTITPTPTPIVFINNAIIYQENGTIFTTTPIPVSIIVGKYENTNKNYTLFQLNIDDQPNKKFYTKKENLLPIPTITGLPTVIHPFKCNTKIGSNEIQIYDDNIKTSSSGGACAKLTLEEDESIFDLSKLKHDDMNEAWWRPRCDDNFEDCIASFKLGSGVKVEFHRRRDCKDEIPLDYSDKGDIVISDIDTNWFWASYTDSISCIKLKPHS